MENQQQHIMGVIQYYHAVLNLIMGGHCMSPHTYQIIFNYFASIYYYYESLDQKFHPESRVQQTALLAL